MLGRFDVAGRMLKRAQRPTRREKKGRGQHEVAVYNPTEPRLRLRSWLFADLCVPKKGQPCSRDSFSAVAG
jgi:hypothetical protein